MRWWKSGWEPREQGKSNGGLKGKRRSQARREGRGGEEQVKWRQGMGREERGGEGRNSLTGVEGR